MDLPPARLTLYVLLQVRNVRERPLVVCFGSASPFSPLLLGFSQRRVVASDANVDLFVTVCSIRGTSESEARNPSVLSFPHGTPGLLSAGLRWTQARGLAGTPIFPACSHAKRGSSARTYGVRRKHERTLSFGLCRRSKKQRSRASSIARCLACQSRLLRPPVTPEGDLLRWP